MNLLPHATCSSRETSSFALLFRASLYCLLSLLPLGLHGQDPATWAKESNDALRKAQNAFFSGKLDTATSELETARRAIESLEGAEAAHPQLKSLKSRMDKLTQDIERRQGTSTPASSQVAASPASGGSTGAVAPPANLPRNTREAHRVFNNELTSLDRQHRSRLERSIKGESQEEPDFVAKGVSARLEQAEQQWKDLQKLASSENAAQHPLILEAGSTLARVSSELKPLIQKAQGAADGPVVDKALADEVVALRNLLKDEWFTPISNLAYESDFESLEKAFEKLEVFHSAHMPRITELCAKFDAAYGTDRDAIEKQLGDAEPGRARNDISQELNYLENTTVHLHGRLSSEIDSAIGSLAKQHDFFRLDKHGQLLALHKLAKRFASSSVTIPDVPALLEADRKAFDAKIASAQWPSCKGEDELRNGAREYLEERWIKDSKQGYSLLGFSITGEWTVQTTGVLGKPTSYGIPVTIALQTPEDVTRKLARVFHLTLRTKEGPNPKQHPPFDSDTVGNSYLILPDAIR